MLFGFPENAVSLWLASGPCQTFFFCLMRWYWVWLALNPFQKRFARWEHSEYLTVSGFGPLPEGLCLIGTRWGFDWLQPKVRVQRFPTRLVPNPFSGCIFTIRLLYEFLFGFGPLPVCVLYQSVLRLCKAPGFFFFFLSAKLFAFISFYCDFGARFCLFVVCLKFALDGRPFSFWGNFWLLAADLLPSIGSDQIAAVRGRITKLEVNR